MPMPEKIIETKICKHCGSSFDITDNDLDFYDKISPIFNGKKYPIPSPSLCPDCRQRRRLSRRNERNLYKRKCDLTGKDMISIYSEAPAKDASLGAGKPFKVYNQKSRRSDDRNPLDYGMLFDPATPFFTQFQKLLNQVPLQALIGANNENSDYINLTADSKNCYIVIESSNNEDCYHCYRIQKCKRCCDCSFCHECEHCYETHNCKFCYNTARIQDSQKCANSMFLRDCLGCSYCFGCSNLVNKSYCVYNQQVSKEEYEKFIKELYTGNICNNLRDAREKFHMLDLQLPKKFAHLTHVENTTGDYLNNAKNCSFCSDGYDVEECKYGEHVRRNAKFVMDGSTVGRDAELIYEAINCGIGAQHNSFVAICRSSSYMNYCFSCFSCTNCFGCVGLRNKEYCVLNRQYSKEEYEKLVPQIIEKMMSDSAEDGAGSSRGEFFPSHVSPFGYNETVAMEDAPLTKEEALKKGFNRNDYETPFPQVEKTLKANELPDDIQKVSNQILDQAIVCEVTGKPFRIVKQELEFYRTHNIPLPHRHPDQRRKERMSLRNPRKLRDRKCMKCGADIKTSYSPERPEIVYCENCYNKEVYG